MIWHTPTDLSGSTSIASITRLAKFLDKGFVPSECKICLKISIIIIMVCQVGF